MRDDLWSFVSCRGLLAEGSLGMNPVWKAAAETNTILNAPLKELLKLKKVWPVKGNKVWIVENSSIAPLSLMRFHLHLLSDHGQFRVASWILLDLLVEEGYYLYYSGDLDPEGVMMAQRLKERYQDRVIFWRMDLPSYEKTISEENVFSAGFQKWILSSQQN